MSSEGLAAHREKRPARFTGGTALSRPNDAGNGLVATGARFGAPVAACRPMGLPSNAVTSAEPAPFREAVAAMNAVTARPEIELGPIRPPQRLAPYSYALGAEVKHPDLEIVPERSEGDAFGRLILLYDPDGADAWDGTIRLVAYVRPTWIPVRPSTRCCRKWRGAGWSTRWSRAPTRSPRWAAPSPPPRRCATATSPDHHAPTSSSCGHRGRRPPPKSASMSRRSARCSSTPRAYRRPGSPTWARGHAPDMGEPAADEPRQHRTRTHAASAPGRRHTRSLRHRRRDRGGRANSWTPGADRLR